MFAIVNMLGSKYTPRRKRWARPGRCLSGRSLRIGRRCAYPSSTCIVRLQANLSVLVPRRIERGYDRHTTDHRVADANVKRGIERDEDVHARAELHDTEALACLHVYSFFRPRH